MSRDELEYWTYEETAKGEAHQRTKIVGANGEDLTTVIDGKSYINLISLWPMLEVDNNILASYPTPTREIYEFRRDSTVVLTLQVDYTTSSKEVFSELRRIT